MTGRAGERGAALVVTLLFAAGMAAAAVAFLEARRNDGMAMRAQVQAVKAEAMLEAALQQTAALIANRSERQVIPAQLTWSFGATQVRVVIESEAGKIDLNSAEESLLQGLPLALGLNDEQATAFAQTILDWRDENSEKHNSGAEDRDYDLDREGSSGAGDRPFAHPAELRYLPAVDPATWQRVASLVTIYSGSASPNRNKASEPVRRAMAIARGLASESEAAQEPEASGLPGTDGGADGEIGAGTAAARDNAGRIGGGSASSTLSDRSSTSGSAPRGQQPGLTPLDTERSSLGDRAGGDETVAEAQDQGTETGEAEGAHAVLLDVRFPNGYEAAAKAVIGFSSSGESSRPFTVLDWTPVLREQSGTP